jgi:hypothetical protein
MLNPMNRFFILYPSTIDYICHMLSPTIEKEGRKMATRGRETTVRWSNTAARGRETAVRQQGDLSVSFKKTKE